MLVLTGGAGFIGSCLLQKLNENGVNDIIVVDNLASTEKWKNLVGKRFEMYLQKQEFLMLMSQGKLEKIDAIIHLGACSSTTEKNADYLMANNLNYTKALAAWCLKNGKKMWYASSAATYGDGSLGYSDDDALTPKLRPLNMYGYSKQLFDEWLIKNKCQNKLTGFRFFNVFGPNEYHKESMRSMILKAFPKARDERKISLFASDRPDYKDGEQKRDFVYVKDVVEVIMYFYKHPEIGGIYNIGTGKAQSWNDVAKAMFKALGVNGEIEYIEMPEILKGKYQYFTEADLKKLRAAGCKHQFMTLEESVGDYVKNYLLEEKYL